MKDSRDRTLVYLKFSKLLVILSALQALLDSDLGLGIAQIDSHLGR